MALVKSEVWILNYRGEVARDGVNMAVSMAELSLLTKVYVKTPQ